MTQTERMRGIATKLLDRTLAGQVSWVADEDYDFRCNLYLDSSTVQLSRVRGHDEREVIRLDLLRVDPDSGASPVASTTAPFQWDWDGPIYRVPTADDRADSLLLSDLYREASRVAFKLDAVFDEVEDSLARPGKVGHDPTPASAVRS